MKTLPDSERPIQLGACLFGVYHEDPGSGAVDPVKLTIEGQECLAVFSSIEKLREIYRVAGVSAPYTVKQVRDGLEFLASLPPELWVILDPWLTERGTTRFTRIMLR